MKLSGLNKLLEQLVPSCFAEPWDNVGLISGDPQQKVTRILLAVDLTPGLPEWELTFMERLQSAGYETGATGKIRIWRVSRTHL